MNSFQNIYSNSLFFKIKNKKSINHFIQFLKHKKLLNITVKDFKIKHASMFVDLMESLYRLKRPLNPV